MEREKVVTSIRYRLEVYYIRLRAWINGLAYLGAISMFLLGLLAVYDMSTGVVRPSFWGYPIPGLFGLDPIETYLYGGIFVMMLGLGLSYRWFVTDRPAQY